MRLGGEFTEIGRRVNREGRTGIRGEGTDQQISREFSIGHRLLSTAWSSCPGPLDGDRRAFQLSCAGWICGKLTDAKHAHSGSIEMKNTLIARGNGAAGLQRKFSYFSAMPALARTAERQGDPTEGNGT